MIAPRAMSARGVAAAVLGITLGAGAAWGQGAPPPRIGLPPAPAPATAAPARPANSALAYRQQLAADLYRLEILEKQQQAVVSDYDRRLKESLQEIIDAAKKPPDPQDAPANGGGLPVGPGGGGPGTPTAAKGPSPAGQRAHAYEMLIYQANSAKAELQATRKQIATLRELVNRPIPTATP